MLHAALYRPESAEPAPEDVQAARMIRNACVPEPGERRTFPDCAKCQDKRRCGYLVLARQPFARSECNQALIELAQEKQAESLPSRCLSCLQAHSSGATAREVARNLKFYDVVKISTALQRLCERGEAYCVGGRQSRRYYAVAEG